MEVTTEVPQTGTKVRFDTDRQFDGQPGDSTLRVQGLTDEGTQVFDFVAVECSESDARVIGWLMRSLRQPTPELLEKVGQEVQATFGSKLTGRDAHQAAEIMWHGLRQSVRDIAGKIGEHEQYIEQLAERFERAAARRRKAEPHYSE